MITKEGITCRFVPIPEGLHILDIDRETDGCIFGKEIIDNRMKGGDAICHLTLEDNCPDDENDKEIIRNSGSIGENVKKVRFTGVSEATHNDMQFTGVSDDMGVTEVLENDAIDTIGGSKRRFTRRDQIKAQMVRRF